MAALYPVTAFPDSIDYRWVAEFGPEPGNGCPNRTGGWARHSSQTFPSSSSALTGRPPADIRYSSTASSFGRDGFAPSSPFGAPTFARQSRDKRC